MIFAETLPQFPGGDLEMKKFIEKNFKYKKLSATEGTKIYVQFTVEIDGTIKSPKIIKGINADLNKEALRVVSIMPKFSPAKNNGKTVAIIYKHQTITSWIWAHISPRITIRRMFMRQSCATAVIKFLGKTTRFQENILFLFALMQ